MIYYVLTNKYKILNNKSYIINNISYDYLGNVSYFMY